MAKKSRKLKHPRSETPREGAKTLRLYFSHVITVNYSLIISCRALSCPRIKRIKLIGIRDLGPHAKTLRR